VYVFQNETILSLIPYRFYIYIFKDTSDRGGCFFLLCIDRSTEENINLSYFFLKTDPVREPNRSASGIALCNRRGLMISIAV